MIFGLGRGHNAPGPSEEAKRMIAESENRASRTEIFTQDEVKERRTGAKGIDMGGYENQLNPRPVLDVVYEAGRKANVFLQDENENPLIRKIPVKYYSQPQGLDLSGSGRETMILLDEENASKLLGHAGELMSIYDIEDSDYGPISTQAKKILEKSKEVTGEVEGGPGIGESEQPEDKAA